MIRQAWLDIVNTINRDKAIYGINLDPLLGVPISISEDMAGYHVDLAMWNISIGGLDTLSLEKLTLERGEALNNLREQSIINIGNLTVEGMYQYTAEEGIQLNDSECFLYHHYSFLQLNFVFPLNSSTSAPIGSASSRLLTPRSPDCLTSKS